MGSGSLSQRKSGHGMALTTHPHLALKLKHENSYTYIPPLGLYGLLYGELSPSTILVNMINCYIVMSMLMMQDTVQYCAVSVLTNHQQD